MLHTRQEESVSSLRGPHCIIKEAPLALTQSTTDFEALAVLAELPSKQISTVHAPVGWVTEYSEHRANCIEHGRESNTSLTIACSRGAPT